MKSVFLFADAQHERRRLKELNCKNAHVEKTTISIEYSTTTAEKEALQIEPIGTLRAQGDVFLLGDIKMRNHEAWNDRRQIHNDEQRSSKLLRTNQQ